MGILMFQIVMRCSIVLVVMIGVMNGLTDAYASSDLFKSIDRINGNGPYLGLVIPNTFEMNPLLQPSTFISAIDTPFIDISGRRFHIGRIEDHKVIVVMTGLAMMNAGLTTQLLLAFSASTVLYTMASLGTVTHLITLAMLPFHVIGLILASGAGSESMNQRYGDGKDSELPLEENGDYTREIGYLKFAKYNTPSDKESDNLLNNVWYQPDEIFRVNGTPEVRQHAFWVAVDNYYYQIAEKIEEVELESCVNSTTCLTHQPRIVRVERGCSANVYVDNAAYRNFLHSKFNVTPIDMETAGVALVCLSEGIPFIAMRSLSDLAGGSSETNEAAIFTDLAAKNAVTVVTKFIKLLRDVQIRVWE